MTDAPRATERAALEEARGLFGPGSISWRIDRELVVLAGGSCALLMQAAHPVVAAGVAQHSTYATDPFGRLMRTLESTFSVVFGTRTEAAATIRRINAIHASVRGTRPDTGTAYSALEPEPLLWVHATLVDTALRVYERFVAPLTEDEREAYHRESGRVAELLGVPADTIPPTLVELRAWMQRLVDDGRVHVTPGAREIATTILHPMPRTPRLAWEAAHLLSLSTLSPTLRGQYGLRWSPARERGVDRLAALSRRILPALPAVARFAPQARAAQRRIRRAVEPRVANGPPRGAAL